MPRTDGPPAADSARFLGLLARVAVAQDGRGEASRFRQCRRGRDDDWGGVDRDGLDVAVHEYEGPYGRGYEVECLVDGWRRVAHVGPETWREAGWHQVVSA
jgi:hypothetical protein